MSKSDSLKNGMRSGLDGLLSSTGKSTQKKEPAPVKAEKRTCRALQFCYRQEYSYPDEIPRYREEYVAPKYCERGDERVFGKAREITGAAIRPINFYTIPLSYGTCPQGSGFPVYTPGCSPALFASYSCNAAFPLSIHSSCRLSGLVPAIAGWFSRRKFGLPRLISSL